MSFDPKQKILVVDDMATMRRIITMMLERLDAKNTHEAADGIPAWEALEKAHEQGEPFDFIISDWNMPGMEGIDLLAKVRADERFKDIPFLMVTAEGEQENVIQAVKTGVSNFIVKPFDLETITQKIHGIFNK